MHFCVTWCTFYPCLHFAPHLDGTLPLQCYQTSGSSFKSGLTEACYRLVLCILDTNHSTSLYINCIIFSENISMASCLWTVWPIDFCLQEHPYSDEYAYDENHILSAFSSKQKQNKKRGRGKQAHGLLTTLCCHPCVQRMYSASSAEWRKSIFAETLRSVC